MSQDDFPVLLMNLSLCIYKVGYVDTVEHLTADEVSSQLRKVDLPRELWILVTSSSLYNLKVMQDGHDVLGHEDIAGVQCHPHHRDQHRVEHGPLPRLQHVERRDQYVLVVEP